MKDNLWSTKLLKLLSYIILLALTGVIQPDFFQTVLLEPSKPITIATVFGILIAIKVLDIFMDSIGNAWNRYMEYLAEIDDPIEELLTLLLGGGGVVFFIYLLLAGHIKNSTYYTAIYMIAIFIIRFIYIKKRVDSK